MPRSRKFFAEGEEISFRAKFGIQSRGIGDVVAVAAAASRGQNRRSIDVGDAEIGEIVDDLRRVLKGEILIELQTIRGEQARTGWMWSSA